MLTCSVSALADDQRETVSPEQARHFQPALDGGGTGKDLQCSQGVSVLEGMAWKFHYSCHTPISHNKTSDRRWGGRYMAGTKQTLLEVDGPDCDGRVRLYLKQRVLYKILGVQWSILTKNGSRKDNQWTEHGWLWPLSTRITSSSIMQWMFRNCLRNVAFNLSNCPPDCPDLNPIEYLWDVLDQLVLSMEAPFRILQDLKKLTFGGLSRSELLCGYNRDPHNIRQVVLMLELFQRFQCVHWSAIRVPSVV